MAQVPLTFTRKAKIEMSGEVVVDVDNPEDWDAVLEAAHRQEFFRFLPLSASFDEEDWEFEKSE